MSQWKMHLVGFGVASAVSMILFLVGVNEVVIGVLLPVVGFGVAFLLNYLQDLRIELEARTETDKRFEEAERFLRERDEAESAERLRFQKAQEQERKRKLASYNEPAGRAGRGQPSENDSEKNGPPNGSRNVSEWKAQRDERYAAAEAQREAYLEAEKTFKSKLSLFDVPPKRSFENLDEVQDFQTEVLNKIQALESYQVELRQSSGFESTTDQSKRLLRLSARRGELQARLDEARLEALDLRFNHWLKTLAELQSVFEERLLLSKETELQVWLNTRLRPPRQPYGVSHEGAEHLVAEWLTYLGESNVEVTQLTGDGGVDVESDDIVCQVKNYGQGGVSSSEMRDLFGTATAAGKVAVLFTSSRLTQDAMDFANSNSIPCIFYDARNAILEPLTTDGARFLVQGHYEELT